MSYEHVFTCAHNINDKEKNNNKAPKMKTTRKWKKEKCLWFYVFCFSICVCAFYNFCFSAPVGYMVELDFRDHFMMESANDCRYDFLEVRDGPYGYSPLIGRYCGRTFPPWIESTGNYMWIRFRSDDILQYSGFRAVYNYKVNPGKFYNTT